MADHADGDGVVGRIKGSTIAAFIQWYRTEVDPDRLAHLIRGLPPGEQALFDLEASELGVLPTRWYPASTIHTILDGLVEGLGEAQVDDLAWRGGQGAAESLRRGVYRVVFGWVLTPDRYARLITTMWKLNYDSGHVENITLGPKRHEGIVRGWRSHHRLLCKLNASVKAALYAAMGCSNVTIEQRHCIDDGDEACGSIISWD